MTEVYGLLLIAYYLTVVALMILLYYYNGMAHKVAEPKDVVLPPSNLTYGELSLLLYNKIVPEVFIANVITLINKNVFVVEKTDKEYYLFKEKTNANLTESEKYALTIIDTIRDGKDSISLTEIFDYCKSKHNRSEFSINYGVWYKIVKNEVKKNFYEQKKFYNVVRVVSFVGIALLLLNIILSINTIAGYLLLVPIIVLPQFFIRITKRTKEYTLEYYKWMKFKEYLNTTNSFALSRAETFNYLCYGIVLGIENFDKKIFRTDFIKYLCKSLYANISAIKK